MNLTAQDNGHSRLPQIAVILGLLLMLTAPQLLAQGRDYLLGPGDKLRVTVFGEPYLTGEYIVSANGSISMPLIEPIAVGGRTTVEAQDLVEQGLKAGFMGEPSVAIEVLAYRPFFVIGEVKNPGSYPYVADMTVLHAVAIAGGFTPRAAKNKIIIQRNGEEIDSVQNTTSVLPDDIVTVKERFF
ncbi:MAG: polysaccharide biosynthesis/export family protein [Lamprobacter sp.]|uniref:polysaccharide biosynthesis/export family protein n=1 Tax=Lamprobacter sp. TaxID=3100796 RepID=UPI002B256665|nr:polysaccharide biosynthesis/export family protein [Lamprobacter sp.]MEA3641101.1 polysaccharide biosynthesis/export family protein [Lamprobacter sp.]